MRFHSKEPNGLGSLKQAPRLAAEWGKVNLALKTEALRAVLEISWLERFDEVGWPVTSERQDQLFCYGWRLGSD